jgi:rhodanese-related sulfurtransferase
MVLAAGSSAALPQHPPIVAGAPETAAKTLREELGNDGKILVIDVRSAQEYATGHIPGAVNIPIEDLSRKIAALKVPKDKTIITVCEHGGRSSRAVVELQKLGYKASSFCRLESWRKERYKLATQELRGAGH